MDAMTPDVEAFCSGLDCAINCNIPLINVGHSEPVYDEAGLHRSKDPAAGSITPYHNGTTEVSRRVPPGGELFKFYGKKKMQKGERRLIRWSVFLCPCDLCDFLSGFLFTVTEKPSFHRHIRAGNDWFESRPQVFGNIPFSDHYIAAEQMLIKFYNKMVPIVVGDVDDDGEGDNDSSEDTNEDPYTLVMTSTLVQDLYENVILGMRTIWDTRKLNALPGSFADVKIALDHKDIAAAFQANATRSLEWLQSEGRCADHIYWNSSTVPGAGRGAFAKRDLPQGTVITGSPLHVLPRWMLDMFPYDIVDEHMHIKGDEVITRQVALNYCFGHPESSVLLLPYGVGIHYLNHNRMRANVRVQWAEGRSFHDPRWLNEPPTAMHSKSSTRLALDYIATRDVSEGDELFLDYGPAWEEAWAKHEDAWTGRRANGASSSSVESSTDFMNAHEWNKQFGTESLRTEEEAEVDPYPENLQIRCHTDLVDERPTTWKKDTMVWEWSLADYGFTCDILHRVISEEDEDFYTITLWTKPTTRWDHRREYELSFDGVPRDAIRFFDEPCSTDMHLPYVFRQPIGLPDELVPDLWRDQRPSEDVEDSVIGDPSRNLDENDEL